MPSDKSNVIEINGRLYDATTGLPVKPKTHPKKAPLVDGFSAAKTHTSKSHHKAEAPKPKPQPKVHHQTTSSRQVHTGPKRASTLNRHSVAKSSLPDISKPKVAHATAARLDRAQTIERSPVISRFGSGESTSASAVTVQPVPKPAPVPQPPVVQAAKPVVAEKPTSQQIKHQLIREGLAKAEAKSAPAPKKRFKGIRSSLAKRPKMITIAATAAVFLLLAGYVTYLNIPNMALKVAASRAGFDANMPGYNPSGFRFAGPVAYSPGQLTVQFKSNTDEREYQITEKQTNWDSESLLDNFVADETEIYQTYQEKGLTIYVYDGSHAAWVNGGVWYTIEGNSMLNTEQLIKIASSL